MYRPMGILTYKGGVGMSKLEDSLSRFFGGDCGGGILGGLNGGLLIIIAIV